MNILGQNLRRLRAIHGESQAAFAARFGLKRGQIASYEAEEKYSEPDLATLRAIAENFDIDLTALAFDPDLDPIADRGKVTGKVTGKPIAENKTKRTPAGDHGIDAVGVDEHGVGAYLQGKYIRPVVATVDSAGRDTIVLVDHRAGAGYLNGYGDPEYVETLPAFRLPGLTGRTYRAFQVIGASMAGTLESGDIIITSYLENWLHVRDERVYVIVSPNEGITVKRIYNYLKPDGSGYLLCEPDNEDYRSFRLTAPELAEIWLFEARLTFDLTTPNRDLEKRVITLESAVSDLIAATEVRSIPPATK